MKRLLFVMVCASSVSMQAMNQSNTNTADYMTARKPATNTTALREYAAKMKYFATNADFVAAMAPLLTGKTVVLRKCALRPTRSKDRARERRRARAAKKAEQL